MSIDTCVHGHPKEEFWSIPSKSRPYCRMCKGLALESRRRAQGVPRRKTAEERFAESLAYVGDCIVWTGYIAKTGYGFLSVNDKPMGAHRYAYARAHGPVPEGFHIDHLCRNRACVNVAHLEAVTPKVNVNRGILSKVTQHRMMSATVCRNGHLLTEETRLPAHQRRRCLICRRDSLRRWRAKQKEGR